MKKTLCLLLAAAFVLGGCGSEKEEKLVCKVNTGLNDITNEVTAKGDTVKNQKITQSTSTAFLGMSEEEINDAIKIAEDTYDLKGVTYKAELKDKELIETFTIDFDKADLKELQKVNLITVPEGEDKADYISLKSSKQSLEDGGYKCK